MRIVANCILRNGDRLALLQKPRRGWWVAPGGKAEFGESPMEAVKREFHEETGIRLLNPQLRGVFTVNILDQDELVDSWMLFTFYTEQFTGELLSESEEGHLEWVTIDSISNRPMAEGDRYFFAHILNDGSLLTGKYFYTPDYDLLKWERD